MSSSRRSHLIAVAVATRDRPLSVARCLDSLLANTVLPRQITVVDQGANASAREVIASRAGASVPIHYVLQPPAGLSASRNAAIAHMDAPVLAFTDDDCVVGGSWVEQLTGAFSVAAPPDAVTGRVLALGPPTPGTHAVSLRTRPTPREYQGRTVPWDVGSGANVAIIRKWILRVDGFDERLGAGSSGRAGEDADILYRLVRAGARVRYDPSVVVYHERLSDERRLATRNGYGHGIGALCALHLRQRDWFALRMAGSWARTLTRQAWRAAARADAFELRQAWCSVCGTVTGLSYGLTVGPSGRRRHHPGADAGAPSGSSQVAASGDFSALLDRQIPRREPPEA